MGTLEEFRIETSPKGSGECVYQGGAIMTLIWEILIRMIMVIAQ